MKIAYAGVITRPESPDVRQTGEALAGWLEERGIAAEIDQILPEMDILIILGGDGTLLHVAQQASFLDIPVVGVNLGNLGFLTEVAAGEMYATLEEIFAGNLRIEHRMMLRIDQIVDGKVQRSEFALNEVVLIREAAERLVHLRCWADREYITTYKADGLIISTPTGSTAYNLSAGGPVVHAGLDAMLVTPICPFMLESRPVLLEPEIRLSAQLMPPTDGARVIVDGRLKWIMDEEQYIMVQAARRPLQLISSPVKNYFTILRDKLNWGGRKYNLPMPEEIERFFD
ncbi:MAG: NAD(+) kinase [Deltaproteobacteria bacterium]|nr:MAG: NAD(+) kinase [Deltaproteobacteria bacterium]